MKRESDRVLSCPATEFDALASDLAARGIAFRLRVWGNSMSPTIKNGDVVVVQPVSPDTLRQGDIVIYRRTGGHTAHRLVAWKNGRRLLLTRGDALPHVDPPFTPEQVIGRVVAVERDDQSRSLTTLDQLVRGLTKVLAWRCSDLMRRRWHRRQA